jgi:hypothetical protein
VGHFLTGDPGHFYIGANKDMQDQIEYAETVAGIRKGLDQARAGEGAEATGFFDELSSRS